MRALTSLLALSLIALPTAAFAHTGVGDGHDLVHGFMHPMGGLDHILAMVAVGIFAFVLGGRALTLVPLAFVAMMAVGFVLGGSGVTLPYAELAIALSSVVIGGVAALGKRTPIVAAMALVGGFATFHGWAHGAEMPADAGAVTFALGFIAATALLHVAGIAASMGVAAATGKYGKVVAQIAGGAFALGGIGVLAGWL
jgi:urease accessory protein